MVFKRWNKTPSKSPPQYTWSSDQMKIIGWCLNKKTYTDPHRYDNDVVYNKVNEYYKYYYDKYNKQQSL